MDKLRGLPREQKMFGVGGAMLIFIISLFLKWFGPFKGTDIDSWWVALIVALIGGGIFVAEALNVPPPVKWATISVGALATVLVFFWALTHFIDGSQLKFGAWLALLSSLVGMIIAVTVWNQERT
jgi:hypothetical protein